MTNGGYVTWPQMDEILRGLGERMARLEEKHAADAASSGARRNRAWGIGLLVISGLVLPLLTTAVITFLHLQSIH